MKVTLYYSPCPLFLAYFNHPWFVVENSGTTDRYEVRHISDYPTGVTYGYLVVNGLRPLEGLRIIPYLDILGRFQARTLATWGGH